MPKGNGYEAIKWLSADEKFLVLCRKSNKVVLMTEEELKKAIS